MNRLAFLRASRRKKLTTSENSVHSIYAKCPDALFSPQQFCHAIDPARGALRNAVADVCLATTFAPLKTRLASDVY